ncbi:MAG: DNA alkylation repair protein [Bacteroidota bacterium]|nr:DNA alkylation repair protein [Bacteroidota bacterium]
MTDTEKIIAELITYQDSDAVKGMASFGINPDKTLGVRIPILRSIAKRYKKQHKIALELWKTEIHEARILASMVDDPKLLTEEQMENWVVDFDSWDICDQVIMNLFEKRKDLAYKKPYEWCRRDEEFVKRAGFVLIARLAHSDKNADDKKFEQFFQLIISKADDNRNFVKKAVNWAIRQIGKRNLSMNKATLELSKKIQKMDYKSAKWIANDAIRELTDEKILERFRMQDAGCKIQDARCRMQDARCRMQDAGCRMPRRANFVSQDVG